MFVCQLNFATPIRSWDMWVFDTISHQGFDLGSNASTNHINGYVYLFWIYAELKIWHEKYIYVCVAVKICIKKKKTNFADRGRARNLFLLFFFEFLSNSKWIPNEFDWISYAVADNIFVCVRVPYAYRTEWDVAATGMMSVHCTKTSFHYCDRVSLISISVWRSHTFKHTFLYA